MAQWSGKRIAWINVEGLPTGYFALPEALPRVCLFFLGELDES